MRQLYVRPSPSLRRRTALAAAQDGVDPMRYARRVLERWILDEARGPLAPVENETGPYQNCRYWVCDAAHQQVRVLAADLDISISALVVRILESQVPREIEIMARVLTEPPTGGLVSSPAPFPPNPNREEAK